MDSKPNYLIIHTVVCDRRNVEGEDHHEHPSSANYLDVPRLFAGDTRASALRGQKIFYENTDLSSDVCMLVYRRYDCKRHHEQFKESFTLEVPQVHKQIVAKMLPYFFSLPQTSLEASVVSEWIKITSENLSLAMGDAFDDEVSTIEGWNEDTRLRSPYDYFYHSRHTLRESLLSGLIGTEQDEFRTLLDYIDASQGEYFESVDAVFASGSVERSIFSKLFREQDLIVTLEEGYHQAFVVEELGMINSDTFQLMCSAWVFDGSFRERNTTITVRWPSETPKPVSIESLTAWPLRLDRSGLQQQLEDRGRQFWSCRNRKLVSYNAPVKGIFELQATNPKYMVDANTYRQMHLSKFPQPLASDEEMQKLGIDMKSERPPKGSFCCLLPPTMYGYGFFEKKWRSLSVAAMGPVPWNKDAFDRLVLKSKKKELIKALVSVHLTNRQNADIIEDKGNGLIILLHGSPGTGKTLTAESVAEIAEKPLYRVTCGDIGTDAEGVEKYLHSVLLVGTIWECVVLLDEADVFLEERQVSDLKRNALVSVFLRVLEYYDGILILTSNRVGTFDEAFKSRVQLAVHYPALEEDGRFEIWQTFIQTLNEKKVDLNFDGLSRKVSVLARHKLNGRQIRNLMWTAGQLARYRKERLEYTHVEQVLEIMNEFEEYLEKTHGHTDEENAQAQGTRIS